MSVVPLGHARIRVRPTTVFFHASRNKLFFYATRDKLGTNPGGSLDE
jgi:hypothetical protein